MVNAFITRKKNIKTWVLEHVHLSENNLGSKEIMGEVPKDES